MKQTPNASATKRSRARSSCLAVLAAATYLLGSSTAAQAQNTQEALFPGSVPARAPAVSGPGYKQYFIGDAQDAQPSAAPTRPSAVLMGGGRGVRAAFKWMIQQGGGGNFVVLRASGTGAYDHYIYKFGGVSSVETLLITTRQAASDPFVLDRLSKAEAVFLAGGDQSDYIRLWKDTPLNTLLNQLIARNVPIGGTSAGLAVLGEFAFTAMQGTLYSPWAMRNPYNLRETLNQGLVSVPGLAGTITDTHFASRDRMGRLMSFLARNIQDGRVSLDAARAIGVDEQTAVLLQDGQAQVLVNPSVRTQAHAYFLRPSLTPEVCQAKEPLTLRSVSVQRLAHQDRFDLNQWASSGANHNTSVYELSVEAGVLNSTQPGGSAY